MSRNAHLATTAGAPIIWGSTYLVTTQFLPHGYPITVAMFRALPAGLFLFLFIREWPKPHTWWRISLLGTLNISIFLICLFIAAYRLPGGVAATVSATQPLFAVFLARILLGDAIQTRSVLAALLGMGGVGLLVLSPQHALDSVGLAAGLVGAASMAAGNVLARRWKTPEVSLVAFTAWQLIAGGVLLVPVALWLEPPLPTLTLPNIGGLVWLSLIGAALTYLIWFRGVVRLGPVAVSALLFLSPVTAAILGWAVLGQSLSFLQLLGISIVFASIMASQNRSPKPQQTNP